MPEDWCVGVEVDEPVLPEGIVLDEVPVVFDGLPIVLDELLPMPDESVPMFDVLPVVLPVVPPVMLPVLLPVVLLPVVLPVVLPPVVLLPSPPVVPPLVPPVVPVLVLPLVPPVVLPVVLFPVLPVVPEDEPVDEFCWPPDVPCVAVPEPDVELPLLDDCEYERPTAAVRPAATAIDAHIGDLFIRRLQLSE